MSGEAASSTDAASLDDSRAAGTRVIVPDAVDARVAPRGSLENLSQAEIDKLLDTSHTGLYSLFRNCALAVLNSGSDSDNAKEIFERYASFDVQILRHAWGIKLEIVNAPASAFVDGQMIRGIKEHLFAVLRDIIYTSNEIIGNGQLDEHDGASITNAVFNVVRNARLLDFKGRPNLAVCWGGHSIDDGEYHYAKRVGYELGLRGLDVCTGCGPGAMKAPMKGAGVGHAKQRISHGRFIGLTEPGIIAAEPPNAIVNHLGHPAGHRKAARGVRAPGPRHRRFPPVGWAPPRRSSICSDCCSIRPTARSRCRWY